jgi:hypothetical protein
MKENVYQINTHHPLQCQEVHERFIFKTRYLLWSHSSGSGKYFKTQPRTEPFQTVKKVTSRARASRFELEPCTEHLLGAHTVTSCILQPRFELEPCTEHLLGAHTVTSCFLQPWFEPQPCAESLKIFHTLTSQLWGHVVKKILSYSAIYMKFVIFKEQVF